MKVIVLREGGTYPVDFFGLNERTPAGGIRGMGQGAIGSRRGNPDGVNDSDRGLCVAFTVTLGDGGWVLNIVRLGLDYC